MPCCCSRTTAWMWISSSPAASRGIDIILGGHTHDAVPQPVVVANAGGKTLVTNAGSSGKFLAVLDLDVGKGAVKDVRYHLLPIYADLLKPDRDMQALIDRLHAPYAAQFAEKLATADELLYRRGNFTGPMDQVICDALRQELDARSRCRRAFAGARRCWPDEPITMEDCSRRPRSPIRKSMCRT